MYLLLFKSSPFLGWSFWLLPTRADLGITTKSVLEALRENRGCLCLLPIGARQALRRDYSPPHSKHGNKRHKRPSLVEMEKNQLPPLGPSLLNLTRLILLVGSPTPPAILMRTIMSLHSLKLTKRPLQQLCCYQWTALARQINIRVPRKPLELSPLRRWPLLSSDAKNRIRLYGLAMATTNQRTEASFFRDQQASSAISLENGCWGRSQRQRVST